MNELSANNKTMSSREIAELTGKRHDNVLRDCNLLNENYEKLGLLKIEEGYYTHPNTGSQQHREYKLTRMQTFDLMTGYNTQLRIKVNRRWEELEKTVRELDFNNPDTVLMLAQNWKKAEEERRRLEITTKEQQKALDIAKPKADLVDKAIDTGEMIDIGQAAKLLSLPFGRNTLFQKLRQDGIFFKHRNEPKQQYMKYFDLKEKTIERDNHPSFTVTKVLVRQEGLLWLSKRYGGEMPGRFKTQKIA